MELDAIVACDVGGALAALAGSDGVYAVALDSGELLWRWPGSDTEQCHVAVVGEAIVSLDEQGLLTTLIDGEVVVQRPIVPTPSNEGFAMCSLPDHSVLVGSPDGWLRRWDPFTGDLIDDYELGGGRISELSAGGGKVLCQRWLEGGKSEWLAFELETRAPVALPAGARRPRLTPDGARLVSLDFVARLDLLDARTGQVLEHRPFGSWPVAEALCFEAGEVQATRPTLPSDGTHSIEARADGTIDITREGQLVARWVDTRAWTCAAIDGDRVAAGDRRGNVALWALKTR